MSFAVAACQIRNLPPYPWWRGRRLGVDDLEALSASNPRHLLDVGAQTSFCSSTEDSSAGVSFAQLAGRVDSCVVRAAARGREGRGSSPPGQASSSFARWLSFDRPIVGKPGIPCEPTDALAHLLVAAQPVEPRGANFTAAARSPDGRPGSFAKRNAIMPLDVVHSRTGSIRAMLWLLVVRACR